MLCSHDNLTGGAQRQRFVERLLLFSPLYQSASNLAALCCVDSTDSAGVLGSLDARRFWRWRRDDGQRWSRNFG